MIDVVMPQLGESVTEGTVVSWRKRVGDSVTQDEYLCDVTTDKVTFEVPAPVSGTLESVLAGEGETHAFHGNMQQGACGQSGRSAGYSGSSDFLQGLFKQVESFLQQRI